jgi:hypothetical protein
VRVATDAVGGFESVDVVKGSCCCCRRPLDFVDFAILEELKVEGG